MVRAEITLISLPLPRNVKTYVKQSSRVSVYYIDWTKAARVRFPNLKPSTTAISLRLPVTLLERIKVAANKRDVPYQSLIKTWLAEKTGTR